jgi:hypothetical protein
MASLISAVVIGRSIPIAMHHARAGGLARAMVLSGRPVPVAKVAAIPVFRFACACTVAKALANEIGLN